MHNKGRMRCEQDNETLANRTSRTQYSGLQNRHWMMSVYFYILISN
jgi:hypothetical protein